MKPRPLRVVHLITELGVGGAETMLARLVGSLDPQAVESTVISLTGGGQVATAIAARGVRIVELGMQPGRPNLRGSLQLVRLLRAIRPHVLQTWLYHADFIGLVAGTLAGVPALAWNLRCSDLDFRDHSRVLPLLLRALALASSRPSAVVSNSMAGRRVHEALGYTPRQWVLIPNGVDTNVFKPCQAARTNLRCELGVEPDTPLVGLVARVHPIKDHPTFIRAAAVVRQRRPDAHFVMIGRGVATAGALKSLIEELGIGERMHLQDERRDLADILGAFDVAVSASYSEGFPNVVIEAMACGVPCVVTDVGDSAAIVAHTGVVVPPKESGALADGVLRLLALSPGERRALGCAARDRVVSEFSLPRATARYRRLYEELAGFTGQTSSDSSTPQQRVCAE